MPTFAPRQNQPQKPASSSLVRRNTATLGPDRRGSHAEEPDISWPAATTPRPTFDFSRISIHPRPPSRVQPKAAVSTPGDIYEREADCVAGQVMRAPDPRQPRPEQERPQIRPIGSGDLRHTTVPPIVHEVLSSAGQPLDAATRGFFEPRLGHDFSRVLVHADERAGDSARAVNASAYTVGRHLVFGTGQYSPETVQGRRLVAHELVHSVQQGTTADSQLVGGSDALTLQRSIFSETPLPPPQLDLKGTPEEPTISSRSSAREYEDLLRNLWDLASRSVTDYVTYKKAILASNPIEKEVALKPFLLSKLRGTLDFTPFCRCAELLGRKPPTFSELQKNRVVLAAIEQAWKASNVDVVGGGDLVSPPHEEGGWIFMNVIDGSLSTRSAEAKYTDAIDLNDPPEEKDSVVVANFHTHPHLGRGLAKAKPSWEDRQLGRKYGVPNLVAINPGKKPDVFQIVHTGPTVREHLASDKEYPGPSGGIAP